MADKKISELTELTTPDGTEELVVNDSGVSKKVQIDNLIADNGLSGNKIDGGTISHFTSTGIDDNATSTAITIDASETVSLVSNLEFAGVAGSDRWIITDETDTGTGVVKMQAGFGSGAAGGGLNLYAHSHATKPGDVVAGISSGSGGSFRVNTTGIDGGTNLIQVDADGLKFNGDTAAANALDDYEEGTWTPTVTASVGTFTTASATGYYTKVGRKIHVQGEIHITDVGTASGSLYITLPFSVSAVPTAGSGIEFAAVGFGCAVRIAASDTVMLIRRADWTSAIGNNNRIDYSVEYI